MTPQFKLHNAALFMALAAAYPLQVTAAVSAGVTQFTVGEVNVRRPDGQTEALVKGKDIESGQAIVTGPTGRAQVKFSDGGLVSLQPNTEFKVSNYVDQADPKQDRFLVDLLRGSMRTITGLIGKRNRDNYRVTTTPATIGIRGSGFSAGYNPDGSLSVTTEFDAIEVCTAAGCVGLTAGESVRVTSNQSLPVRTNTRADVPTPETKQEVVVAGNQVDKTGANTTLPTSEPPTGSVKGIAFTSFSLTASGSTQRTSAAGTLQIGDRTDAAQPIRYATDAASGDTIALASGGTGTVTASSGTIANGDYSAVGTWTGGTWLSTSGAVNVASTTFAAGIPSPISAFSALNGKRGSYALNGATPVFSSISGNGVLLPLSKIEVDFNSAGANADINLNISMPAQIFYNLRGSVISSGAGLNGELAVTGTSCTAQPVTCGLGSVGGSFVGKYAEKALLSFMGYSQASGVFGGAASFLRVP